LRISLREAVSTGIVKTVLVANITVFPKLDRPNSRHLNGHAAFGIQGG
jgi:hypothetical protein